MRLRYFHSAFLRFFGYFLYAVLLTVALLYWLFPSEDLCNYLQAHIKGIDTRLVLNIDRIRPCLPFGFESFGTKLFLKENPDTALFSSERMIVKPRIWPLLQGRFDFGFECSTCGGDIIGRFHFKEGGLEGPFEAVVKLKDIRIGDNKYLPVLLGHSVQGNLDGDIRYHTTSGLLTDGSGRADFRLREGVVRFSRPFENFRSMEITALETEMLIKDQQASVNRFALKSRTMNITLKGSIGLEKELAKSKLVLKGECELSGTAAQKTEGIQARKRLPFQVEGPLSKPKLILTSSQVK
jgi:type II secretion system protein N